MCGIYGFCGSTVVQDECIKRLTLLRHRGPDNVSWYINESNKVFLGHTRLSILDPGEKANQPFVTSESVLIFNGEIYNYKNLQSKYLSGKKFQTSSDTEILISLLDEKGENIVSELNGMFAFCYYSKKNKTLLLARDVTGIKPLYFQFTGSSIQFSSEIKSLMPAIDEHIISDFIQCGTFQSDALPFRGIVSVTPGSYVQYNLLTGKMGQRAYSPLKKRISRSVIEHNRSTPIKDIASELEKRIIKSIELHLQSDAPIAALCSGGIDSSLISAIAKKINPHLELYHAGVYGKGGEEKFARMMEDHLNCKVNYTYVKQDEFLRELPFITYISDLPIYHPNDASLSILAKKIKTDGIKVLLSGEGADELFGGYSWHHRLINREKTISNIERFPKVKNALARVIAKLPFDECLNIRAEEFREFYAAGIGKSYSGSYTMAKACQFTVMQYSKWKRWQECKTAYDCLDNQQEAFGLSLIFSDLFDHLGTILHRTDRILMAHSIEGRVPFLENNIMDLALNLPLNCKVNGRNGKHILKIVAEKYLPSSVIYRPKMGFPVPWQKYIENVGVIFENGYVQKLTGLETNDLCSFYKNDPTLKWRMLALEIWGRIFERNEKWQDIKIN